MLVRYERALRLHHGNNSISSAPSVFLGRICVSAYSLFIRTMVSVFIITVADDYGIR